MIQLPQFQLGDMAILDGFLSVINKLGEFSKEFQKDWSDGEISKKEFNQLREDSLEVQKNLLVLISMIEELVNE